MADKPEEKAREGIDQLLTAAGWAVRSVKNADIHAARAYDELIARDKASPDVFRLEDDSLADSDNLPPPDVIAREIVEYLEAALEQFRLIAGDLDGGTGNAAPTVA